MEEADVRVRRKRRLFDVIDGDPLEDDLERDGSREFLQPSGGSERYQGGYVRGIGPNLHAFTMGCFGPDECIVRRHHPSLGLRGSKIGRDGRELFLGGPGSTINVNPNTGLEEVPAIWPTNVVHYQLDNNFSDKEKRQIRRAFAEFHAKTNVRFQPHTFQRDYVFIRHGPSACFADLGYVGGKQEVELSSRCVNQHGRICHELMHSLGFDHEQCRTDRDGFVLVNWRNITKGYEDQFAMRHCLAEFLPYDYHSVMHYKATAFAKDPTVPTLVPRERTAIKRIGQRARISKMDSHKINTIYTPWGPDASARLRKVRLDAFRSENVPVNETGPFYAPLKRDKFILRNNQVLMDYTPGQGPIRSDQTKVFQEALRVKREPEFKNSQTGERMLKQFIRQRCNRRWSTPTLPSTRFPANIQLLQEQDDESSDDDSAGPVGSSTSVSTADDSGKE